VKYADDCTIYTPQYCRTVSSKQLQDAADEVDTWCTNNNMLLNVNKSMTMMVKPANNRLKPAYSDVRLNDSVLKNVTDARVLGVILDESLTFKHHVQHVLSKANTKLHVLKILSSHGVDSRNKLKFYKACILPSLLYAIEAWYGFTTEADRKRLDSFQNLALKLVYCDTQSYLDRLAAAGLECFSTAYEKRRSTLFYSILIAEDGPLFNIIDSFKNENRRSQRGHGGSAFSFSAKTKLFTKSFFISNFLSL
jgi:hypothetical protein